MNHDELVSALKQLRLTAMAEQFTEFAKQAERGNLTFEQFLAVLATAEIDEKRRLKVFRLLKEAKLPRIKEISDFDFTCRQGINRQQVQRLVAGE